MTDDRFRTMVTLADTGDEIGFQDYFVRLRHGVPVSARSGSTTTEPTPTPRSSTRSRPARSSSPRRTRLVSIGPIRALPGVDDEARRPGATPSSPCPRSWAARRSRGPPTGCCPSSASSRRSSGRPAVRPDRRHAGDRPGRRPSRRRGRGGRAAMRRHPVGHVVTGVAASLAGPASTPCEPRAPVSAAARGRPRATSTATTTGGSGPAPVTRRTDGARRARWATGFGRPRPVRRRRSTGRGWSSARRCRR
jgi:hypothetical protein